MNTTDIPTLYKKYFVDKKDERRSLFEAIQDLYKPQKGIYPGSFVHLTPSFYIKEMTYIDSDKRISRFFDGQDILSYVNLNKTYPEPPVIQAFQADFSRQIPIEKEAFDIMFSFYAGFISQSCKQYLRNTGILVCNNSHGDASLAFSDKDYSLIAVIDWEDETFKISEEHLDRYFIKKDGTPIDRANVLQSMKGERFTREAYAYVFRLQTFH
ncbi:hypothetical protein [Spirochaeta cellobiosiphila]|uniref:hypothetical protein n=1 Tax=Spirochaeta cellobiosiphila TaxID=504483 RepID=UPI0004156726|nr:hypothetical protein [Spirochaeta cellobiosiphila]